MTPDVVETSILATARSFAVTAPEPPTATNAATSAANRLMILTCTSPPLGSKRRRPDDAARSAAELKRTWWIFLDLAANAGHEDHAGDSSQASNRLTASSS